MPHGSCSLSIPLSFSRAGKVRAGALPLLAALVSAALGASACGGNVSSGSGATGGSGASAGTGGAGGSGASGGAGGGTTSTTSGTTSTTSSTFGPFSCSGNTVGYAKDVEPILHCGGAEMCHQLTLGKPGGAYPFLVNQPTMECADGRMRVKPGDPEHSYLIHKLTNQNLCGSGNPMPKTLGGGWNPLSQEEVQTVYDWICQGAKND
jgi:hypothetical protein